MGVSETQSVTTTALTGIGDGPAPAGRHELYVGLDIGRRHHMAAIVPRARMEDDSWRKAPVRTVATTGTGYRELIQQIESSGLDPQQIAIGCEPTGGCYSLTVAAWLEGQGHPITWLQSWALHARRGLAIGQQTKTDALDARLIARLLYEHDLGLVKGFRHHPSRNAEALRLLVRNRLRLVQERVRYRLQLTAIVDVIFPELKEFFRDSVTGTAARLLLENFPTPDHVTAADERELYALLVVEAHASRLAHRIHELRFLAVDSLGLVTDIEPFLTAQKWLLQELRRTDRQISDVEQTITEALDAWPVQERAIMASFPGMTKQRTALLLAFIGDFSKFDDDRQLRKLLGWYPELRESGSTLARHRLGRSGNRVARREIWLWCLELISPNRQTPFRAYYHRLRDRGVKGKVAMGHLAGKLISVLFFCMRHGQPYDPEQHARQLGLGSPSLEDCS